MGKRLIQQRRGKGSGRFRTPKFRNVGQSKLLNKETYTVKDLIISPAHTAPLMRVEYQDGDESVVIAPEGIRVGDTYTIDDVDNAEDLDVGHAGKLGDLPEGTIISNIENNPGDGGKFVKSSGTSARIVSKSDDAVTVLLPSKKRKEFNPKCRAMIGTVAGGGRTEKPLLKAGKNHHIKKARNRFYPIVSGSAMNAVAHPFGNKRSLRKSKARPAPRNAPPGRKVGSLRPKNTGRKR